MQTPCDDARRNIYPIDRRRVPELEALGYRVIDRLKDDWRGEFMVLMAVPIAPPEA